MTVASALVPLRVASSQLIVALHPSVASSVVALHVYLDTSSIASFKLTVVLHLVNKVPLFPYSNCTTLYDGDSNVFLDLGANCRVTVVLIKLLAPQYIVSACEVDDSTKSHYRASFTDSGGSKVQSIPSGLCTKKKQSIVIRDGHFIGAFQYLSQPVATRLAAMSAFKNVSPLYLIHSNDDDSYDGSRYKNIFDDIFGLV